MTSLSTRGSIGADLSAGKAPRSCTSTRLRTRLQWTATHADALRLASPSTAPCLVRGLGLTTLSKSAGFSRSALGELMAEREAFSARRSYSDGVYSTSRWPSNQPMCMHHELSYALEAPGLMLFACLSAPNEGGATAVADASAVLDALPADLVARFEREGWLLTRSYNDEIGASYAEAFGSDDPPRWSATAARTRSSTSGSPTEAAYPPTTQRRGPPPSHRTALLVQPDRVPQRMDDRP